MTIKRARVALVHFNLTDYTASLANALDRHDVDLVVIHPRALAPAMETRLHAEVSRVAIDKPRIRSPRSVRAMTALVSLLRSLEPDVVHLQQSDDPWVDLTFLVRRPATLITTVHDLEQHPGDSDQVPGSGVLRRRMAHRSHGVIVHTQAHADRLAASGYARSRIASLPHGELGSLYRDAAATHHARVPGQVLFFGRIWRYKGLDVLIEAMEQVRKAVPAAHLVVAGRGDGPSEYFDGPTPEWCSYRSGPVADAEVAPVFEEASVVVLPYREASQSGVALLAYGFARPLVASAVGGLAELIRGGEDGLLVPPERPTDLAAALVSILSDDAKASAMSRAMAQRSTSDLSWDGIAQKTVDFYQRILSLP